jgi:hypothetical protein
MPCTPAPIGSVWATGSWSDTAWCQGTWADAVVAPPVVDTGGGMGLGLGRGDGRILPRNNYQLWLEDDEIVILKP